MAGSKKGQTDVLKVQKSMHEDREYSMVDTHLQYTELPGYTESLHSRVLLYDSCATFFPHSDESSLSFDFPYRDTRDTIVQAQYPLQKTYCVLTHTQRHAKAKIDVTGVEWWRELFCLEEGRSGHR